jgi:hypothetical protein
MNEIIKAVCNRTTGFSSPVFFFPEPFTPAKETPSEQKLREVLKVTTGDNDYEVFGILQAIYAFPEYAELFAEKGTTCVLDQFERPAALLSGGILLGNSRGPAVIERKANEWPVQKRFNITRINDKLFRTYYNKERVDFEVRESDGKLFVTWPEFLGVRGDVEIMAENPFQSGFQMDVIQHPLRFPYKALYEHLRKSTGFMSEILLSQNLVDSFYYAQSPIEGVAVAATALGLNNREVYG